MKKLFIVCILCFGLLLSASPNAQAATYKYDDRDRLVEVKYDDGKYIKYTYDAAGNMTEQQYFNGETIEKYAYFQPSYDVATTKQWKIGFNKKLDAASVNENTVYVLDVVTGQKVSAVTSSVNGKTVTVAGTYESGKQYMLVIENVKGARKAAMNTKIVKTFTVK